MTNSCATCQHYAFGTTCRRYPTFVRHSPADWCGEWTELVITAPPIEEPAPKRTRKKKQ